MPRPVKPAAVPEPAAKDLGGRPRLHPEDAPSRARRLPQELVMRIEAVARFKRMTWAEWVEKTVTADLVEQERELLNDHAAKLGLRVVG